MGKIDLYCLLRLFNQFTLECEKDRHLPFLDLNVYKGEQGNFKMCLL